MVKLKNVFLLCCLMLCVVGCSDDDDSGWERIYPTEDEVKSMSLENIRGSLWYNEKSREWVIAPSWDDFFVGIDQGVNFLIRDVKDEYKALKGKVIFDGTIQLLYYELEREGPLVMTYYSLQIETIEKYEGDLYEIKN